VSSNKDNDLLISILLSLIMLVLAAFNFYPTVLRVILAALFVFALPGYVLTAALFPNQEISRLERLLYSVGLSLAVTIIGGLALNFTPWGLRLSAWGVLLPLVTLIGSLAALLRRRKAPASKPAAVHFRLTLHQGLMFGLAGLVGVAAIGLARLPSLPFDSQGYTSLWMLQGQQSQSNTLVIGIHSQEFAPTQYRLVVTLDGKPFLDWRDIQLDPGQQWQRTVPMPTDPGPMEAILYREDNPNTVYRYVTFSPNLKAN
jgi:uncharacterized membrane protein